MNTGPVAHRYAKALLKFVQEAKTGEKVYSQVGMLVARMQGIQQLTDVLQKHPELPLDRKLELLDSALGEPASHELKRFVTLVDVNGRMEYLERMLYSFLEQYREANAIKVGRVVTACPVPGLRDRLQSILSEMTAASVYIDEEVDPSLIGGFVLNIDDLRMDASVEGQFRRLRQELISLTNN